MLKHTRPPRVEIMQLGCQDTILLVIDKTHLAYTFLPHYAIEDIYVDVFQNKCAYFGRVHKVIVSC